MMGKWVSAAVLDGALTVVSGATRMLALAGQPASYAAALSGRLAEAVLAPGDFSFTPGNVSGRKVDVAAKADVPVTASGTADHVALVDAVSETLIYVTTCPAQALVSGGTVNFGPWSIEFGDPQ
jgi:hypothetical protein